MANDNGAEVRRQAASKIVSALGFPTPEVTQGEKDIYLHRILDTLYRNKRPESPSKKAEANTGLSYATSAEPASNVSVTEESYYPASGFDTNDILAPNKTSIDWFSGENAKGVPPEMAVSSGLAVESPVAQEAPTQQKTEAKPQIDLSKLDVTPMRRRRSSTTEAIAAAKDVFDFVSGVDPNSYIGKTLEVMNKYDKTRMEEDPEGYQADLNRAKVLSQKAQEETDPARKAIYGREIKKLLPTETQGLSDEIAADYFTAGLDNKIKLEQLKGYNKLQQIQAQNQGKLDVQNLKNLSASELATMKAQAMSQEKALDRELKQAIADGNNERALTVAQIMAENRQNIANLNNEAKMRQTEMQQSGAMARAQLSADAAQKRVETQQAGALQRTMINKGQKTVEQRRSEWPQTKATFDANMADMQRALDILNTRELFGPVRGAQLEKGGGSAEDRQMLGYVRGVMTQAVQQMLAKVRAAAGTGKAVDSEAEAQRALGYLSSGSNMDQNVIVGAIKQFMDVANRDMRLAQNELFGIQPEQPKQSEPAKQQNKTSGNIKSLKIIKK